MFRAALRGGVRQFHQIQVHTIHGGFLIMEPDHLAEAVSDTALISIKDEVGNTKLIGHAGMIKRLSAIVSCSLVHDNFRRCRHSFSVDITIDE